MVKQANSDYWLNSSMESFVELVWKNGLHKFASDTDENEVATLESGNYIIDVDRGSLENEYVSVRLSDSENSIFIVFDLKEDVKNPFKIVDCSDNEAVTEMIYDITDCWTAGFFKPPEPRPAS